MSASKNIFRIALTADFFNPDGSPLYNDFGISLFDDQPQIEYMAFQEHHVEIAPHQLSGIHAAMVLTPKVTAASIAKNDHLLAIGRFGVGYDSVDVQACTDAGVLLFIATGAVDRSVAEATIAWMFALSHHVRIKDRLVRENRWHERHQYMGSELRERTLGVIGLGGIARKTIELLSGFGMATPLAFDPYASPESARKLGVELVGLNELLRRSDFVSIHCPLNKETRGLLGHYELSLLKPTAFLINTARGGIIDDEALCQSLKKQSFAGAALDCFGHEPLPPNHPFKELNNVLLAPHSIAWTNELFRDIGKTVCQGMIDLSRGKLPSGMVNPEVTEQHKFQQKWHRYLH